MYRSKNDHPFITGACNRPLDFVRCGQFLVGNLVVQQHVCWQQVMIPSLATEVLRIESFGNLRHSMHSDIGWEKRVYLLYKAGSLLDR